MNRKHIFDVLDEFRSILVTIRPFDESYVQGCREFFRVSTTWSSNALEGNTFTESETKVLIEDGITIGGKSLRETFETLGHADAFDYMFTLVHDRAIKLEDINELHRLFYKRIDEKDAGVYRKRPVFISGSEHVCTAPECIESAMNMLIDWSESNRGRMHPIEYAAELHRKFVEIHPYIDGNGRTARLIMNTALIQDGFLPIPISPYQRLEYVSTLEKSHRGGNDFTLFIAGSEIQTMKDFMRFIGVNYPKVDLEM